MANKVKRTFALLLAIIMLLLCGCGKQGESNPSGKTASAKSTRAAEFENVYYKGDYKQVDGTKCINNGCFAEGRFYYDSSGWYSSDEESYNVIFSCLPDGSDVRRFDNFSVVGKEIFDDSHIAMRSIAGIFYGEGGYLYVVEQIYAYVLPESEDGKVYSSMREERCFFFLHKVSISGNEHTVLDLSKIISNNVDDIPNIAVDPKGNIYGLFHRKALFVYDSAGEELFSIGEEIGDSSFADVSGEKVILCKSSNNYGSEDIFTVNLAAKSVEKVMSVSSTGYISCYPGVEGFDFSYSNGTSLFGANIDTKETVSLLSFSNCGVDFQSLFTVFPIDGGISCVNHIYGYDGAGNANYRWGITMLKRYEGSDSDNKTVLTLATASGSIDDSIYKAIVKFNQISTEYRVVIKDYSVYSSPNDTFAGSTVLNTEIVSGKSPDIFITDSMDATAYADRGIFENLWPYIDADEALGGREALVEPVFDSMCYRNGALYEITPTFKIYYIVGDCDVAGSESDWSFEKLKSALAKMPEGCPAIYDYSKTNALYCFSKFRICDFIDWEKGICTFNTPEFIECLTFIKDYFPDDADIQPEYGGTPFGYERLKSREALLISGALINLKDFQLLSFLCDGKEIFIGWPGAENGSCAFGAGTTVAMSSTCEHKDAAWEFMRLMLTEEMQLSDKENKYYFCTNKNVFDAALEEACTAETYTDKDGNLHELPKGSYTISGLKVDFYAMTEEQRSEFLSLIENTKYNIRGDDSAIFEIVAEEAEAFFAGKQDEYKTANAIQSRVELYMAEKQ